MSAVPVERKKFRRQVPAEHKASTGAKGAEGKCGEGKCGEGKCGGDKKTGDK